MQSMVFTMMKIFKLCEINYIYLYIYIYNNILYFCDNVYVSNFT